VSAVTVFFCFGIFLKEHLFRFYPPFLLFGMEDQMGYFLGGGCVRFEIGGGLRFLIVVLSLVGPPFFGDGSFFSHLWVKGNRF